MPQDTAEVEGVVVLTGIVEREDAQYVSYCRELGTASCGATAEEALENLKDALEVHLDALTETGEIIQELRERNINVYVPPLSELRMTIPLEKMFTTYQHKVPVAASA
mgnify:FL=1